MQVDDLRVYNRLFAPDWGLTLLGGTGTVSGRFEVTPRQLTLDLDLASDDAGLRHGDYRANTHLLLQLCAQVDDRSSRCWTTSAAGRAGSTTC